MNTVHPPAPAFERIEFELLGLPFPDEAFPEFSWARAEACFWRGQTLCARWSLARLAPCAQENPARAFALPGPDPADPPASLWLGNLREMALSHGWAQPADLWCEVGRAGWGGYDFNRVQERRFSTSGGALDGACSTSWQAYAETANLPEELLCALPWLGLPGMWGDSFPLVRARRESIILGRASDEGSKGSGSGALGSRTKRGRSGRGLKA